MVAEVLMTMGGDTRALFPSRSGFSAHAAGQAGGQVQWKAGTVQAPSPPGQAQPPSPGLHLLSANGNLECGK